MYSKSQCYALEVMCRQRAAVAREEMECWLNETEEWTRVFSLAVSNPTLCVPMPGTGKVDGFAQSTEIDNSVRFEPRRSSNGAFSFSDWNDILKSKPNRPLFKSAEARDRVRHCYAR
jgi:hypothetical protein